MFKANSIIFLVIALLLPGGCSVKHADKKPGKEVVLKLEPGPGNPRNSEGDFIQLKDGRILFVYTHFTEGTGDNAGAFLAGRISTDKGKTWSDKDVTVISNEGGMNVMSVSLIRLANGRIALFYLRKNSETDCVPVVRFSDDEAKTWSAPVVCIDNPGYYVMNNDRAVQLTSGRIILPVALHNTPDAESWFNGRLMCYYSDDEGKSWKKGAEVKNPENVTSQEPGVVELNGGKVMLFCRTSAGVQYFSWSEDQGETWSELRPGNIKSPLSPASIERIPKTGDLLLVWNNNFKKGRDGGKRTPFNLAVSGDEGRNWKKLKTIESDPAGWYCYTAIEFAGNHVLLGHCAGNTRIQSGLATTHITRLSLDWIYSDATSDPVVVSDSTGMVTLACKDKDAQIRYTLDGTLPSSSTGIIYKTPFKVTYPVPLLMQAFGPSKTPGQIISLMVGVNVFQPAQQTDRNLENGLNYRYYEGKIRTTDSIEMHPLIETGIIQRISIENSPRSQNFAYIFDAYIKIPKDGLYSFFLESNDGSVLMLNEHLLINNDGSHGVFEEQSSTSLRAGMHKIMVKYFQLGGGSKLQLKWEGPGISMQEIPAEVLFH